MDHASVALRAAVFARLSADAGLAGVIGASRVHDLPPPGAAYPYVTLGEMRLSDLSAGDAPLLEHQLVVHGWSQQGGHREAHAIAGAVMAALDDAPLTLAGHRLVHLRFVLADIRREAEGRTYRAALRFRAVTEPLG